MATMRQLWRRQLSTGRAATRLAAPTVGARIDLARLKADIDAFEGNVAMRRIAHAEPRRVLELAETWRAVQERDRGLRERRNALSVAGKKRRPTQEEIAQGKEIKSALAQVAEELHAAEAAYREAALMLPNWLDPEAPVPASEAEEKEEGRVVRSATATPMPQFEGFEPRAHTDLAEALNIVDFTSAVVTSGPKFATLQNEGAMLELALTQWVFQVLRSKGFTLMLTPELVHSSVLEGCGFQPRGATSHVYRVSNESSEEHKSKDLCLVGTAEVPLVGSMAGRQLRPPQDELPRRLAAFSHCFRAEAGAAGAAERGLYRLHQFGKSEMVVFCRPEQSAAMLEELVAIEEALLDELGLHWRTIDMFPHELGHPAARKFDVQVYMPSRGDFGEVASVSNCTDYQTRRLSVRYSDQSTKERGFLHTLNGTAIAVPRVIIALLETHQREDGSVALPPCLWPFMAGLEELRPPTRA